MSPADRPVLQPIGVVQSVLADTATAPKHDAEGVPDAWRSFDPGASLRRAAPRCHPLGSDLIGMGRSDMRRPDGRYVGSQTEHLLEFTDSPVVVVPSPPQASS